MNRGPQRPMAHARALELAAQGMRPRYITKELNADPALAEERGGRGFSGRTVSDWVKGAADDGTLAAMRAARQGEPERAEGDSAPTVGSGAPGVTAAPAARVPRRNRLDVLYATIERQEGIASDPTMDERVRVSANDAIARALGILDKLTQGDGVVAELDGLALTVEEVGACVAHVRELRRGAAQSPDERNSELETRLDAEVNEMLGRLASIAPYVEVAGGTLAMLASEPRLAPAADALARGVRQAHEWRGFQVWRRVLAALPEPALAAELCAPDGESLATVLERALGFYRRAREAREAHAAAEARAAAEREQAQRERDATWVKSVEMDVLLGQRKAEP